MKKILTSIFIIIFLLSFSFTNAQLQPSIDGVNVVLSPENPAEGDSVTLTLESYIIDLDSSSIVWIVNGKTVDHGNGLKKISVTAPKTGNSTTVLAVIKSSDGKEFRKTTTIKSGSVEIVWESGGYTPPFFKGKIPLVYQNNIKLVAIPHLSTNGSSELNPKDLIYKWKVGGKYIDGETGFGKQSIKIKTDIIPKPLDISVEVYSRDQNESATKFISIVPTEPSVELYEMSSLYGILLNKALIRVASLNNTEISILAIPFGFNFNTNMNPLNFFWSINNVEQSDLIKNRSIVLKTKGDTDGVSDIGIEIRNEEEILQSASSLLRVNFKKSTTNTENNITF